jgi:hypothetical protein
VFFLFEPRLRGEKTDWFFSFFISPAFIDDSGVTTVMEDTSPYVGINLLSALGHYDRGGFRGGISLLCYANPDLVSAGFPVALSVSPFFGAQISDYILQMTVVLRPLDIQDPASAGELRFSLKAVF